MPEIYGIDVSKYQNAVDWKKVKAAGKDFVFVRLGWAGWDGELNADSMAATHIKGAAAAGLHVGAYVYSYCKTPGAAKLAAGRTIEMLKPFSPIAYPVAFDIEDTSASGTPYQTFGKSLNNSIVSAFLDEIEKSGYYAMLYTYKSFAENYLDMAALKRYDVWIAQYASKCGYAGSYGIWQYAGDSGRCDGVTGACDLNVAYTDYAALIKASGINGYTGAPETSGGTDPLKAENEALRAKVTSLEDKLRQIVTIAS